MLTELGPIHDPDKPMPHELIAATKFTGKGKPSNCPTHAACHLLQGILCCSSLQGNAFLF